jgi:hypothetical protein
VILTGFGLPDDGLHSPNEKLDLHQLWEGIDVFGRFYASLAKLKAPKGKKDKKGKKGKKSKGQSAKSKKGKKSTEERAEGKETEAAQ